MKIVKVTHDDTFLNKAKSLKNFQIENYNSDSVIEQFVTNKEWLKRLTTILTSISTSDIEFAATNNRNPTFSEKTVKAIDRFNQLNPMSILLYRGLNAIKDEDFNNCQQRALFKILNELSVSIVRDIYENSKKVETISLERARETYPETRSLSIGTYTLHPRNSKMLTPLENFHKNLAMQKDHELIVLLGKMGAKSLRRIEGDISENLGKANVSANTVKVGSSVDIDIFEKIGKEKDLLVEFEGNVVNLQPNLLDNSLWFSDDSKLISIYESRKFDRNKIVSYTLRNTYTETFDFDFDLAANYLVVKADLKAQYQSISKKERLFEIEFGI